ncbi:MAG: hypothetical protein HOI34_02490 [Rhodospirillaceae bacterium]|jgi:hypothetical protein|nr:hypothetical protein [Rhodospirillaceae bacterium]MBT6509676.1 hypothetical protein [Rhodospirillaceae bacterium]MBT7613921.1 hypothetical protein [Rhodospirillaceae bacterium]MBT7647797.1 hypothetical protein [Rhodospirillaceae bacterium]
MKDLIEFLVVARRETYAIPDGTDVGDGTQQMLFDQGPWRYRDRYAGQNPYGGHEIVWRDGKVIWMKNYIAEVLSDQRPMAEIYDFQREVLGQPDPEHLMRGPARYTSGHYSYSNTVTSDLARFSGEETIAWEGTPVYRMILHGSLIGQ